MWKLVFAVCLLGIRTPCAVCKAASTPLYTVTCKSTTEADITLAKPTYKLRTSDGLCTPTSGAVYTITNSGDCTLIMGESVYSCIEGRMAQCTICGTLYSAMDKTFIVEDRSVHDDLWNDNTDIQAFKLTCIEEDNGAVRVAVASNFKVPKPTLAAQKVTGTFYNHPHPTVTLVLLTTEPHADQAIPTETTTATLGATLYLTIVDAEPTDTFLIPLNCSVKKAGPVEIPLWQPSTDSKEPCSKETDIIKSQFGDTLKTSSPIQKIIYMQMKAFKFADNDDDIIISCGVRVCQTIANGLCKKDSDKLKACSGTTASKTGGRRRREVGDSASPHGRVHYLTTTMRVFDDVMEHGTSGSTTMRYTLPVLLMAMLAKLIL